MYREIFKVENLKRHFLSGLSYMIPLIIMSGFCTAIARIIGGTDVKGSIPYYLLQAGNDGFSIMIAVLAAGIGYSIAGKSAIAPGLLGGYLSTVVNASFLGGIIVGITSGMLVLWCNSWKVPKTVKSMIPLVIIPLLGGILESLLVMYVIGPPLAALTSSAVKFFMGMTHASKFVLGFLLGSMTGFDMGGPVNKISFAIVTAFASSGVWGPAAGKNVAAMAPPLGIALSVLVFARKKYTQADRENAKAAIIMSMCQVTEGALPFAFADPVRVVPSVVLGSGIADGLILSWGVTVPLLSGGIFTIPVASNPFLYLAALLIGACITGITLSLLKPKMKESTKEEEVHDDLDIDINIE